MWIRRAEPDDAMPVAWVHVRSWQAAYRGLLPDDYLNAILPEERAQYYDFASVDPAKPRTIVALEDGVVLGFASTAPSRDADLPGFGELVALYVDPAHWGRGMGVALVAAAREQLVAMGFKNAALWVLSGNARADRFYRRDGWVPDGARKSDTMWSVAVQEVRYRRELGNLASLRG
jgi:GNAT superfamily N-acetyltransferase